MRRTRLIFFVMLAIMLSILLFSYGQRVAEFSIAPSATAVSHPLPTPSQGRSSAPLPSVKSASPEGELSAEVRDVLPLRTSIGAVYFVGEVVNTGSHPIAKPETIISLLDAEGKRLAFETGYTVQDIVMPGETVPVTVIFSDPPETWSTFEVFLQAKASTGREFMAYTAFTADYTTISKDDNGYYVLSGTVQNTGESRAEFIQAVASLYGEDGKIVGIGSAYLEQSKLDVGEQSAFTLRVTNLAAPPVFYRLQFVGHAKASTP